MTHETRPAARRSPRRRQTVRTEPAAAAPFAASVLRAALLAAGIGVALLLLLCAVCLSAKDPGKLAPLLSRGTLLLSALLCGILAASFTGHGGLAAGAAAGGLLTALLWGLSLCLPGEAGNEWKNTLLYAGIAVVLSSLGGYLVTHRRQRQRKNPRR